MEYATLPSGERIPTIGLGTWGIGGGMTPNRSRDVEMVATIEAAIHLGYTHLDTAEMYAGGHTEELIGQAIRPYPRKDLFITTKVSPSNLRARDVLTSLQASLNRLGTDYVDLYLIHWPDDRIPLEDTFLGLNEAVQRGQARHLGVSNFNLSQLQHAQRLSAVPLATNQVPYSLRNRRYVQNGVLAFCQANGILLTAYSPLKGGLLQHELVNEIAKEHAASPAQVALHWLIRQPQVITIPKSARRAHLEENLGALEIELTEEKLQRLNQLRA